ncbi:MAG: GH92 family glycosyl hydrolase [bacterium]
MRRLMLPSLMPPALMLLAVLLGLGGCDEETGRVGDAPDESVSPPGMADMGPGAGGTGGDGGDARPAVDAGVDGAAGAAGEVPPVLDPAAVLASVDLFIGTGGVGFNYAAQTPAAQMPLGMVRLGPDTTWGPAHPDFHHFSGYHFSDPDVRGFSHTHFVGTGVVDYGNLRVLPWRAALADDTRPGLLFTPMDKATERASPGRYDVRLPEQDVDVTLTASTRAGVHRYRFGEGGRVQLLIDAAASAADRGVEDARVVFNGTGIDGQVTYRGPLTGRTRPFTLYFSARADQSPVGAFVWDAGGIQRGAGSAQGDEAGAGLEFEVPAGGVVELRVGISFIGPAEALANLGEVDRRPLEEVAAETAAAWADLLGRVRIGGGTVEQQRTFYTALYHSFTMPTRLDEGGRYRGLDGEVHETQHPYYTDLSLWDTFRTLHPWYILVAPEVQRDCLRSLLKMADDGGLVPRWPAGLSYGGSMIGTSADLLFAGSALKGIDGIDYDAAFDALWRTAGGPPPPGSQFGGRTGMAEYLARGWLPTDTYDKAVSNTLEFAYSDWALAALARSLGRPEAAELEVRGQNHTLLFDPAQGFFAPRTSDGAFQPVEQRRVYMGRVRMWRAAPGTGASRACRIPKGWRSSSAGRPPWGTPSRCTSSGQASATASTTPRRPTSTTGTATSPPCTRCISGTPQSAPTTWPTGCGPSRPASTTTPPTACPATTTAAPCRAGICSAPWASTPSPAPTSTSSAAPSSPTPRWTRPPGRSSSGRPAPATSDATSAGCASVAGRWKDIA